MTDDATIPRQRTPADRAAITQACRIAGIAVEDAEHLRTHVNEAWLVRRTGVVVRIATDPAAAEAVTHTMCLITWLAEQDAPVIRPWAAYPDPVLLGDGRTATFWRALRPLSTPDYRGLGRLLREIHSLSPPEHLGLPRLDPYAAATEVLDDAWPCRLSRHGVADRLAYLADLARTAPWPQSLIHGDAHIGNVLLDDGRLVLADWDSAAVGPSGWDLIPTAVEPQRWARSPRCYQDFVAGYGDDVTTWPQYAAVRELAEWHKVAERIKIAVHVPRAGRNICHHLTTLLDRDADAAWYGPAAEVLAASWVSGRRAASRSA